MCSSCSPNQNPRLAAINVELLRPVAAGARSVPGIRATGLADHFPPCAISLMRPHIDAGKKLSTVMMQLARASNVISGVDRCT
jgi:hypothetical protein